MTAGFSTMPRCEYGTMCKVPRYKDMFTPQRHRFNIKGMLYHFEVAGTKGRFLHHMYARTRSISLHSSVSSRNISYITYGGRAFCGGATFLSGNMISRSP